MTKTCVVGAGRMGSALARALLAEGIETRVWNRSPEKVAPPAALDGLFKAALAAGHAADDFAALMRFIEWGGVRHAA